MKRAALEGLQKTERLYYIERIVSPLVQRVIERQRKDVVKPEYLKEKNTDI